MRTQVAFCCRAVEAAAVAIVKLEACRCALGNGRPGIDITQPLLCTFKSSDGAGFSVCRQMMMYLFGNTGVLRRN